MKLITIKNKILLFLFFICSYTSLLAQQSVVQLASLRLNGYKQEILEPQVKRSMTGETMRIAGRSFEDGISVHAPFSASVYLAGKASSFKGFVGVDDGIKLNQAASLDSFARTDGYKTYFYTNATTQKRTLLGVGYSSDKILPGSIEMIVYGDDREIWRSGIIKQNHKAKEFSIDLKGIQLLKIVISDGGDNISGDVANLVAARIETSDPGKLQFIAENQLGTLKSEDSKNIEKVKGLIGKLPVYNHAVASQDWLIQKPTLKASVSRIANNQIVISNGLISRTIIVAPNAATISLKNLVTGEEYIRAVQPEAVLQINKQDYDIGGLGGQVNKGYLLQDWLNDMYSLPGSFVISNIEIKDIIPELTWASKRWLAASQWKATGKELILSFIHSGMPGVTVRVHHKIFDNIPLVSKSISVLNGSKNDIVINHFTSEIIAYSEKENFVATPKVPWSKPNFFIENDYAFGGMNYEESDQSVVWETDPSYTSQVNYSLQTPCIVKSKPAIGPEQVLSKGNYWNSFNTYTLALDGTDRERNTLAQRKMYRTLAPWVTQNPIFMHLTSTKDEVVKTAVDQCVATGYEMIILSFGSGLNMENQSDSNLNKFKRMADYAHSKGIEIGGYSLMSSRSINPQTDVIDIKTGKPGGAVFHNAPCMGSEWGIAYLNKIKKFFEYTGFDLLEHDGPYPGDYCASTTHPGHKGYFDSQWTQWKQSTDLYKWLLSKNIYMNTPDFYMLNGSTKTGIGYREVNWSLPRAQQIILGRQNLYDGTWTRTPSMGWTFVPLTEYQGGGAAATLEPLSEHLTQYAAIMKQNYGSGVQACYRGNRLFDTDATMKVVKKEIDHYKKYREILNADIIHLKRPDGRDWDGILHVDPQLQQKGFAMLYNPLSVPIQRKLKLPLYYAGIKSKASVSVEGGPAKKYILDNEGSIYVDVTIPAQGSTWLVIQD